MGHARDITFYPGDLDEKYENQGGGGDPVFACYAETKTRSRFRLVNPQARSFLGMPVMRCVLRQRVEYTRSTYPINYHLKRSYEPTRRVADLFDPKALNGATLPSGRMAQRVLGCGSLERGAVAARTLDFKSLSSTVCCFQIVGAQ